MKLGSPFGHHNANRNAAMTAMSPTMQDIVGSNAIAPPKKGTVLFEIEPPDGEAVPKGEPPTAVPAGDIGYGAAAGEPPAASLSGAGGEEPPDAGLAAGASLGELPEPPAGASDEPPETGPSAGEREEPPEGGASPEPAFGAPAGLPGELGELAPEPGALPGPEAGGAVGKALAGAGRFLAIALDRAGPG